MVAKIKLTTVSQNTLVKCVFAGAVIALLHMTRCNVIKCKKCNSIMITRYYSIPICNHFITVACRFNKGKHRKRGLNKLKIQCFEIVVIMLYMSKITMKDSLS